MSTRDGTGSNKGSEQSRSPRFEYEEDPAHNSGPYQAWNDYEKYLHGKFKDFSSGIGGHYANTSVLIRESNASSTSSSAAHPSNQTDSAASAAKDSMESPPTQHSTRSVADSKQDGQRLTPSRLSLGVPDGVSTDQDVLSAGGDQDHPSDQGTQGDRREEWGSESSSNNGNSEQTSGDFMPPTGI